MKNIIIGALALTAVMAVSVPALSATFTVQVRSTGCEAADSGDADASASCNASAGFGGGASASASAGRLSTTAVSFGTSQGGDLPASSRANAVFTDTLFFDVSEGFYSTTADFLGLLEVSNSSQGTPFPSFASVSGGLNGSQFGGTFTLQAQGDGTAISTFTGTPDELRSVKIPFTNGSLVLNGGLFAEARCGTFGFTGDPETCSASSNFSSSLRLLSGQVLDTTGILVANSLITSSSGFDYNVGFEPHVRDGVSAVPLPGALPLMVGGLGLLGLIGWRRRVVT